MIASDRGRVAQGAGAISVSAALGAGAPVEHADALAPGAVDGDDREPVAAEGHRAGALAGRQPDLGRQVGDAADGGREADDKQRRRLL